VFALESFEEDDIIPYPYLDEAAAEDERTVVLNRKERELDLHFVKWSLKMSR
jgi:hypothetical protein